MQSRFLNLAAASFGVAAALALTPSAQAHEYGHHHHHYREAYYGRPLTVTKHHHHYYAEPVAAAAPDPWHVVSLPFRAANSIFPAYGDPATNPLIFVGAPVHVVAQAVEFPFYAVGTVFGGPPAVTY
jgi:hypothetical protein